jgi:hypothetical protein
MQNINLQPPVQVKAPVNVTGGEATSDEIISIAKKIWKKALEAKIETLNNEQSDELLNKLQDEFKDFSQTFPLVLRWMIQMKQFNLSIFKTYIKKFSLAKVQSREEYLDLQAEYLVMLYRHNSHHPDEKKVQEYRRQLIESLIEEDKAFKEIQKEVEEQMKQEEKELNEERKKKIYKMLLEQGVKKEESK